MSRTVHSPLTDEYLQSLQGMEPAETDPYFYTRLRARMEKKEELTGSFSLRPVLAVAALSIVLLLNALTILQPKPGNTQPVNNITTMEDFSREFNINAGDNY